MTNISGRVVYDENKTGAYSSAMKGIANVPVVLQNIMNCATCSAKTDAAGFYQFLNVPNGTYQLLEAYGLVTPPAAASVDFPSNALYSPLMQSSGSPPILQSAAGDSLQAAGASPAGSDSVSSNRLILKVDGCQSELVKNFLNSPMKYSAVRDLIGTADLEITMSVSPSSARVGSPVTFDILAKNLGPDAAQNVVITDNLPAGLLSPDYSDDNGTTWKPWTGEYAAPSLASGAVLPLKIRAMLGTDAPITNSATIASDSRDPVITNNVAPVRLNAALAGGADISVVKTASPVGGVKRGNSIIYTITVSNNGPDTATNVVLTDALPSAVPTASCFINGDNIPRPWTGKINLGTLAANTSTTVYLKGIVTGPTCQVFSNTASASSSAPDSNPLNNSYTVTSVVR
jgi:uncharacterized repeat protein (TIGR01451 family)